MAAEFDPIQVEVWRHLFASIAEEMGATLERTGYSPNIKERRDHSCALFDSEGRLLARAWHIGRVMAKAGARDFFTRARSAEGAEAQAVAEGRSAG